MPYQVNRSRRAQDLARMGTEDQFARITTRHQNARQITQVAITTGYDWEAMSGTAADFADEALNAMLEVSSHYPPPPASNPDAVKYFKNIVNRYLRASAPSASDATAYFTNNSRSRRFKPKHWSVSIDPTIKHLLPQHPEIFYGPLNEKFKSAEKLKPLSEPKFDYNWSEMAGTAADFAELSLRELLNSSNNGYLTPLASDSSEIELPVPSRYDAREKFILPKLPGKTSRPMRYFPRGLAETYRWTFETNASPPVWTELKPNVIFTTKVGKGDKRPSTGNHHRMRTRDAITSTGIPYQQTVERLVPRR